jgi:hypothetical protein
MAFTAGDGLEEPTSVCDAACRQHWIAYGDAAMKWLAFAGIALVVCVGCGYKALKNSTVVEFGPAKLQ